MCDTEKKKALIVAVGAVLEAHKRGGALARPMAALERTYRAAVASDQGPAPATRRASPEATSGPVGTVWFVVTRGLDGRTTQTTTPTEYRGFARSIWMAGRDQVAEPFATATLYSQARGEKRRTERARWQCDPHGLWVELPAPKKGGR